MTNCKACNNEPILEPGVIFSLKEDLCEQHAKAFVKATSEEVSKMMDEMLKSLNEVPVLPVVEPIEGFELRYFAKEKITKDWPSKNGWEPCKGHPQFDSGIMHLYKKPLERN